MSDQFNLDAAEFVFNPDATEFVWGGPVYEEPQEPQYGGIMEFDDEEDIDPERTRIALPIAFQIYSEQTGMPSFFLEQRFTKFVGTDVEEHVLNGVTLNDFWIIMYNAFQHEASEFPTMQAYDGPNAERQTVKLPPEKRAPSMKPKKLKSKKPKIFAHELSADTPLIIPAQQKSDPVPEVENPDPGHTFKPFKYKEEVKFERPNEAPPDKSDLIQRAVDSGIARPDAKRQPVNIIFVGHVDSGKSTICGQILLKLNKVDSRLIEKNEKEARVFNQEAQGLAYVMDENIEERERGKTVEVGRSCFETSSKRFTILDAPGHKSYLPNMVVGTSQADYAALVISARIGEFEAGFDKGGQTQEHALLVRSLGVKSLVVIVNKMDDVSVIWGEERWSYIVETLQEFLRDTCKFTDTQLTFVPASGLYGENILERTDLCEWYSGPSLIEILDELPAIHIPKRKALRFPIISALKDHGFYLFGKVEAGMLVKGEELMALPSRQYVEIAEIYNVEEQQIACAAQGENIRIKIKETVDIPQGNILVDDCNWVRVGRAFTAEVLLLELLPHKPIIAAGYESILHLQTSSTLCTVAEILYKVDIKARKKIKTNVVRSGDRIIVRIELAELVCMEAFAEMQALGRFALRDEGSTIALGKILAVEEEY